MVEGLNYSVQTVTTVGYGNWAPSDMAFNDPRLIQLKEFSIGLMLVGASLFASMIGVLANWLGSL